jgi:acetyl-CoA carboxylase biotin carboxylase subunit
MDDRKLFKKILVANRGEIAIRVIRACKELGIPTVAVYSEADRAALHARMADEAYCIGAPPSGQSYASADRILEAAKKANCDAIHPGYGFLSEHADFVERCTKERITFIGPNPNAIRVTTNKISSRLAADKVGVPVVPGMMEELRNEAHAAEWAGKIGCPLMLKATAGSGGNGMRKVDRPDNLQASYRAAKSEARNCFGDGTLYLERYVDTPRHVEMQVLADKHGNIVHCMEREGSIQRRYQSVIEEAPSSFMDDELRGKMSEAAIRIARAIKLDSAGTVEFLVSGKTGEFFFLGMHAGLSVGHAVTESITGIDLCKEMIAIAAGRPLTLRQEEISIHGHAIECRIHAEDPDNNFLARQDRGPAFAGRSWGAKRVLHVCGAGDSRLL